MTRDQRTTAWWARTLASLGLAISLLTGCASSGSATNGAGPGVNEGSQSVATEESSPGYPTVAVTSYPLAFIARSIGGDEVQVVDLSAKGGHVHDMELSAAQVNELSKADLALYLSQGFQPAVEAAIKQTKVEGLDAFAAVPSEAAISGDPHVWLDPANVAAIGQALSTALDEANPDNGGYYKQNANALTSQMEQVDSAYESALRSCAGQTLLTSHEAFGYLAARFDLDQVGVLGVDPDAEPSPARLREVRALVEDRGVTTLFAEPSGGHSHEEEAASGVDGGGDSHDPRSAESSEATALGNKLAASLQVGLEVLDPIEVQLDPSRDLVAVYADNLMALQRGLPCATPSSDL